MYRRRIALIIISSALILLGQMLLFRIPAVFNLCLKTYLYDNAYWVKGSPKVLFMGSSRCYHNIDPNIVQENNNLTSGEVVNLGNDGATPFEMLQTYVKNREKLKDADVLIFVLDSGFFYESSFVDRPYEKILLSKKQWSILSEKHNNFYFLPSIIFFNAIRLAPSTDGTNMGFRGLPSFDFLPMEEKLAKKVEKPIYCEDFPLSGFEIESLISLKTMFEEDDGIFVLALAPYWDARKLSEGFMNQNELLVSELNDKIGPVRIVGSWHREKYGLNYEDFKDSSHLSLSGAEKYTSILFSDIEAIKTMSPDLIGHLSDY